MELKILRSHDYGNVLNSDRNSNYYDKFYFSFFEFYNQSFNPVMKNQNIFINPSGVNKNVITNFYF